MELTNLKELYVFSNIDIGIIIIVIIIKFPLISIKNYRNIIRRSRYQTLSSFDLTFLKNFENLTSM